MKNLIYFFLASAILFVSCKKEGCTDPTASNYWKHANVEDGSCYYRGLVSFWQNQKTPYRELIKDDCLPDDAPWPDCSSAWKFTSVSVISASGSSAGGLVTDHCPYSDQDYEHCLHHNIYLPEGDYSYAASSSDGNKTWSGSFTITINERVSVGLN